MRRHSAAHPETLDFSVVSEFVLATTVEDVYMERCRLWLRLREKGGKAHAMPCHHNLEAYLTAYIDKTGILDDPKGPLFRTIGRRTKQITRTPLSQPDAYRMIERRTEASGIETKIGNRSFRATGISAYLKNGGTLEKAASMANHASTAPPSSMIGVLMKSRSTRLSGWGFEGIILIS